MGRKYLIFLLPILYFGASCQKENYRDDFSSQELFMGEKITDAILKQEMDEDKRLSFSALNPSEKFAVWNSKLSKEAGRDMYSEIQVAEIENLLKSLKKEIFDKNSDYRTTFYESYMPEWLERAEKIFSQAEIYFLVFSLDSLNELNEDYFVTTTGSENCICAINSAYTCGRWNGDLGSPGFEFGNCSNSSCISSSSGCGALWDLPCNGMSCSW